MKIIDIVKEYFPKASDDELDFILWEKTGYPSFFRDGENSFRKQLATFKRACELNCDVCYCCGKIRFKNQIKHALCNYCNEKIIKHKEKGEAVIILSFVIWLGIMVLLAGLEPTLPVP